MTRRQRRLDFFISCVSRKFYNHCVGRSVKNVPDEIGIDEILCFCRLIPL